jgi:hypothetical protein
MPHRFVEHDHDLPSVNALEGRDGFVIAALERC